MYVCGVDSDIISLAGLAIAISDVGDMGIIVTENIYRHIAGGFIMLAWWGANLSVAVWVGFLVLFGVADDDSVVISTYLESIFDNATFNSA